MQKSKYYMGIPTIGYYHDNDINISTIDAKIWKIGNNTKHVDYSNQEVVDMVIKKIWKKR